MIVIKTRQPDPELEQKIRMLLEREHIEAEQISIDSWGEVGSSGAYTGRNDPRSVVQRQKSLPYTTGVDLLLMLASHEDKSSQKKSFSVLCGDKTVTTP